MTLTELENLAVTIAFIATCIATLLFILQLAFKWERLKPVGYLAMGTGLVGAGATLVLRGMVAQHAPWSNLWESLITVIFATFIFYFIVEVWYKPRHLGLLVAPMILIMIGSASLLPPNFRGAAPLMPALQSYWIKVHVLIMLFSYAAFLMSFASALAYFFFAWRNRGPGQPLMATAGGPALAGGPTRDANGPLAMAGGPALAERPMLSPAGGGGSGQPTPDFNSQTDFFDELTYRLILMGFPLLMLGIITGAMWANGAWGTYWSWDPKETWSLITWFVYAAYLHARISRDWTGHKAAGLACLGFVSVIVTYIGVNYLSSGLHSYGFLR